MGSDCYLGSQKEMPARHFPQGNESFWCKKWLQARCQSCHPTNSIKALQRISLNSNSDL